MSFLLLFYAIIANLLLRRAPIAAAAKITAVFAFGDSILDSGNNNHLVTAFRADHRPYGQDLPEKTPTGRFSDGKLTTDFIVSFLGIKEMLPPYLDPALNDTGLLTGASFASAGSGLDDLTARAVNVLTMGDQLKLFQKGLERIRRKVGAKRGRRVVGNGLFVIAVGSNDVARSYYGLPFMKTFTSSGYHDFLLKNFESFILRLYKMGARKFGLSGLPPVGCLPIQMTLNLSPDNFLKRVCVNQQNVDSQAYNTKLQALISRLQGRLKGSKIAYFDAFKPMMDMINNPQKYGELKLYLIHFIVYSNSFSPLLTNIIPIL
nr:GDSL esterase/lipase At2g40250 [Ipomoea batatas]GME12660.1 GDSL esterase/lipase At2g40250 [Ipomoea batatas]